MREKSPAKKKVKKKVKKKPLNLKWTSAAKKIGARKKKRQDIMKKLFPNG